MAVKTIEFVVKNINPIKEFTRKDNTGGTLQILKGNNGRPNDFNVLIFNNDVILSGKFLGKTISLTNSMWMKTQDGESFEVKSTKLTEILYNGKTVKPSTEELSEQEPEKLISSKPVSVGDVITSDYPINKLVEKIDRLDNSFRAFVKKMEEQRAIDVDELSAVKYQVKMLGESNSTTKQFVDVFDEKLKVLTGSLDIGLFTQPRIQSDLEKETSEPEPEPTKITKKKTGRKSAT